MCQLSRCSHGLVSPMCGGVEIVTNESHSFELSGLDLCISGFDETRPVLAHVAQVRFPRPKPLVVK